MNPELAAVAHRRGGTFTRADALAAGYSPAEIRGRLRRGEWVVLCRGVYAHGSTDRGVARLSAVLQRFGSGAALSHRSAARILGLPLVGVEPGATDVTVPGARSRTRRGVSVHGRNLPPEHVQQVGPLRVTNPVRTAVDLARVLAFPAAVCVADAGLRISGHSQEQVSALLAVDAGPGSRSARRVLAFADARAESPGESLSRVAIASHGLPPPQLQTWVGDATEQIGRVDFLWPAHRTVGEFDGRGKYDRADVLWAEKCREDRLRAAGFQVVRWTWADVTGDFTAVAARLCAAFVRGRR